MAIAIWIIGIRNYFIWVNKLLCRYFFHIGVEKESDISSIYSPSNTLPTQPVFNERKYCENTNFPCDEQIAEHYHDLQDNMLTYRDKTCGVEFTYPQVSHLEDGPYLWFVDAQKKSYIDYEGRAAPTTLDWAITLFRQKPNYMSIYWDVQLDIVCAENDDSLTTDSLFEKNLAYLMKAKAEREDYLDLNTFEEAEALTIDTIPFRGIVYMDDKGNAERVLYYGVTQGKMYLLIFGKSEEAQNLKQAIRFVSPR